MENCVLKEQAHIVYAADNGFAEIMGISIISVLENSRDMADIFIYILDSGIGEENKTKIESIFQPYQRKLPVWIPAKNISRELSMEVAADRGSLSQYARLFVSSALPEGLKRVLYLDCDTIIVKSISELWNLDMKGKTIGALMDAFSKQYRTNIGLRPNDIMFNSGVMLIDLCKWKQQDVEKRLLNFIAEKKGRIQQGDQGALNAVLADNIFCFEPSFNSVTIFYDFTYKEIMVYRKPPFFYTEEQIKKAVEEPRVIHFTTSFLSRRPWVKDCRHRYTGEWMKFKEMSPWKNKPLWEYKRPWGLKGLYILIASKLPRRILIGISGLLQVYGRPLVNKLYAKLKVF